MADTTFVPGTVIVSSWLNDVNRLVYDARKPIGATLIQTSTGQSVQQQLDVRRNNAQWAETSGASNVGTTSGQTVQQELNLKLSATALAASTAAGMIGSTGGLTVQQALDNKLSPAELLTPTAASNILTLSGQTVQERLDLSFAADGSNPMTGTLQMGGNLIRNLSPGSMDTDAATVGQYRAADGSSFIGFSQPSVDTVVRTAQEKLRDVISVGDFGAAGDGVSDDTEAIQKAIDYCTSGSLGLFVPPATYRCTSTVFVTCELAATGATFRFPNNFTLPALVVSSNKTAIPNAQLFRKKILLPEVLATKTGQGWAQCAGSVGVLLVNIMECQIDIPRSENFEIGVSLLGLGLDCNYNSMRIGRIYQNQINFRIMATTGGSCNENEIYGGRFALASSEAPSPGVRAPGTRLIQLRASGGSVNNNQFYGPSIEGLVDEYSLELWADGSVLSYNTLTGSSVEDGGVGGKTVRFTRTNCQWNNLAWGYGVGASTVATLEENGAANNSYFSPFGNMVQTSGVSPVFSGKNSSAAARPVFATYPISAGLSDLRDASKYTVALKASGFGAKNTGDEVDRLTISSSTGQLQWGDGAAPADVMLGRGTSNTLRLSDGDTFHMQGTWDGGLLRLGNYRIWVDDAGLLRIKNGAPTSATDGTVVGTQT